jgi:hypothetical protein
LIGLKLGEFKGGVSCLAGAQLMDLSLLLYEHIVMESIWQKDFEIRI